MPNGTIGVQFQTVPLDKDLDSVRMNEIFFKFKLTLIHINIF